MGMFLECTNVTLENGQWMMNVAMGGTNGNFQYFFRILSIFKGYYGLKFRLETEKISPICRD